LVTGYNNNNNNYYYYHYANYTNGISLFHKDGCPLYISEGPKCHVNKGTITNLIKQRCLCKN